MRFTIQLPGQRVECRDEFTGPEAIASMAAARAQRSAPLDICMVPFGSDMYAKRAPEPEAQVEAIGRLERLGVTWTTAVVPGETRAEFLEGLQRHAEQVVLKLRPPRAAGTGGGRASANQPARGAAGPRSGRQ